MLKKIIKSNYTIYKIYSKLSKMKKQKIKIESKSKLFKFRKDIVGSNNSIYIDEETFIDNSKIRIRGNNNKLKFGKNVKIGPECSFYMEWNNISIIVGDNTTFALKNHINAQENDSKIYIGNDCAFSNNIIVRTSDSHPICDVETNERINKAKDVYIGNHVWIAPNSKIFKGVKIGDGSIIGSDTLVTKDIEENCLAVGHPAKVVKRNIRWTREKIF